MVYDSQWNDGNPKDIKETIVKYNIVKYKRYKLLQVERKILNIYFSFWKVKELILYMNFKFVSKNLRVS